VNGYLIIESRDPLESNDVAHCYGLAAGLARQGAAVTLFLVQNGIFPARRSASTAALAAVVRRASRCSPTISRCASGRSRRGGWSRA
jgi:sulfur relay (sulfurtransferase) complex TusBCD TusD component (DsrE family)